MEDRMNDRPTAIIMAGGKSSRMGTDKGLMEFNGKHLVRIAIEKALPFCSGLKISTQNEEYKQFGFPLLPDEFPELGPIGGIFTALKNTSTSTILVIACDMPLISAQTIQTLIENQKEYDCAVPRVKGKYEPLCAIYSKSMLRLIESSINEGDLAIYSVLKKANCCFVDFELELPDFININTPADLEKLKSLSL